MNSQLAALQAKQAVAKMRRLQTDVQVFASHAKAMSSMASVDPLLLLDQANGMLTKLKQARGEFLDVQSQIDSLTRGLSSRAPAGGGMSPAAQWGPELRAGVKQFDEAVITAELALNGLYGAASEGMNRPTRTSTGDPTGLLDILVNFADFLAHWIENYRRKHGK